MLARSGSVVLGHYRSPQPWGTIVLGSLLGSYLSMILWLAGYKLTDASIAAVLNETAGAFIVLFAWWLLKEEMNGKRLSGVALAFIGVAVVVLV
jgi:drug/metabolite transporter (DMT)-like permease